MSVPFRHGRLVRRLAPQHAWAPSRAARRPRRRNERRHERQAWYRRAETVCLSHFEPPGRLRALDSAQQWGPAACCADAAELLAHAWAGGIAPTMIAEHSPPTAATQSATPALNAAQPQLGMLALASLIDLMSVTTVSGTPCSIAAVSPHTHATTTTAPQTRAPWAAAPGCAAARSPCRSACRSARLQSVRA